jgi:hypothetical protein
MLVTYELTQKDFLDSLIAHRNRSALRKWSFRLLMSIVFLFLGISLIAFAVRPNNQVLSNFVPLLVLGAFWASLFWIAPWWAARKQFSNQPGAQGPKTILLDPVGVHWRWNGGSADVEWKNYIRILEGKSQFLLYSSPVCFNVIPKRAFTAEQLSELRALLAESFKHPIG